MFAIIIFFTKDTIEDIVFFLWDAGTSYWLYNWELRNVIEANVGRYKKLVIHYDLTDHESWSYILEERKDCVSFSILNSG